MRKKLKLIIDEITETSLKEYIKKYLNTYKSTHGLIKIFSNKNLSQYLDNYPENLTVSEKLYCVLNELVQPDNKCNINECNNRTEFKSLRDGYNKYCSKSCRNKNPLLRKSISNSLKKFHSNIDSNFYNKRLNVMKSTNIDRYGHEFPMQSDSIKEKLQNTMISKYGVKHNFQIESVRAKSIKKYKELKNEELIDIIDKLNYTLISNNNNNLTIKCDKGHVFEISRKFFLYRYKSIKSVPCISCNLTTSNPEQFIINILNEYKIKYELNNRTIIKPLEIDIFLPEYKIAIEVNGTYYHSEIFKDKMYHLNKTEKCDIKNIQLLHIWDDQIYKCPEIIKSIILNRLGKSERIYARKCEIREVSSKDSSLFLEENHLQGKVNSSIKLGLYYEGDLVSLMTFGALRRSLGQKSKEGHYELLRFCNKLNTTVIGGASRLFKRFLEQYSPKEILSYANRDRSNGNLYKQLGFKFDGYTKPGYYWIKNNERFYRFNFRKSVLINRGYDKNKSAINIMYNNEYYRIFDSGNLRFIYNCENYI